MTRILKYVEANHVRTSNHSLKDLPEGMPNMGNNGIVYSIMLVQNIVNLLLIINKVMNDLTGKPIREDDNHFNIPPFKAKGWKLKKTYKLIINKQEQDIDK